MTPSKKYWISAIVFTAVAGMITFGSIVSPAAVGGHNLVVGVRIRSVEFEADNDRAVADYFKAQITDYLLNHGAKLGDTGLDIKGDGRCVQNVYGATCTISIISPMEISTSTVSNVEENTPGLVDSQQLPLTLLVRAREEALGELSQKLVNNLNRK